jgi:excisionase family DNA binding protein
MRLPQHEPLLFHHQPTEARLLTQAEAARLLRLSERTLERLRVAGGGPKFVKAGRSVRYRQCDLDAWIEARVVNSTSEATP